MSQRPLDLLISIRMTGDSAVTVEIRRLHQQLGKGARADSSWLGDGFKGSESVPRTIHRPRCSGRLRRTMCSLGPVELPLPKVIARKPSIARILPCKFCRPPAIPASGSKALILPPPEFPTSRAPLELPNVAGPEPFPKVSSGDFWRPSASRGGPEN